MKTDEQKDKLLKQLKKTPIIQIACERTGISRATFYRWKKQDPKFCGSAEKALCEGIDLINELAESQLISGIKDKNMTAIIYWLKHNHQNYKTKIEISGKIKTVDDILTSEQKEIIKKAIEMGYPDENMNLIEAPK